MRWSWEVLVLARVQFYDQSGVSTLESGFREDHCSEGPGPGFGKWFGARLGSEVASADFSATRRGKFRGGCWDNPALYSID